MAGGGEVDREVAADTRPERTVKTSTRQETKPSWKSRGAAEVVAARREERARWKRAREEESWWGKESELGFERRSSALAIRVSAVIQW